MPDSYIESIYRACQLPYTRTAPLPTHTPRRPSQCSPAVVGCDYADLVPFRPEAVSATGSSTGEIDYRLARLTVVNSFRAGRLARHDVCDAHPELVRAAREVGDATTDDCPICDEAQLVHVTYVFGPRLPAHGRWRGEVGAAPYGLVPDYG